MKIKTKEFYTQIGDKIKITYKNGGTEDFEVTEKYEKPINEICVDREDVEKVELLRPMYETIFEYKRILDKEEKEWLENFLRPFKNNIQSICKYRAIDRYHEFININTKYRRDIVLPDFKAGTMYKGMGLSKEYTLKELDLFEGE